MFKARKKEKKNFVINLIVDDKEEIFEFSEPTFEVKIKAVEKLMGSLDGDMHMIRAGAIIVDACYKGDLSEIKLDEDVYISLCVKAATLVTLYEGELKKN